ncbi:Type II secretion system protein F [Planctomycetes bacterium Pla163]|uniref:Type II secretion system protein F n=1 Tax=Rohdeia mirabilis TaxID=2528008 RepID=A0A518D2L2_9BACT|nr:Type II secretion system protein F [Planctomycetes bacterium Pla163]
MSDFNYDARDDQGNSVQGSVTAETQAQALAQLRKRNLTPVSIKPSGSTKSLFGRTPKDKPKAKPKSTSSNEGGSYPDSNGGAKKGFSLKSLTSLQLTKPKATVNKQELVIFTRQLSTMIGAGLSLLESLDVLGEQAETPGMRITCERLTTELRGGSDLSAAMETCPKAFTSLYVSMVRAGEASGQMDIILERLAEYVEEADELRREVKSAMTYPVISLVLVLGITSFLMLGVVPTFRQVFESLDTDLPALTTFVLNTSDWLKANYMVAFGGSAGVLVGLYLFKKTRRGSYLFDRIALNVPIFGPMARKVALARFSRTFSTLTRSGVPIMGTLDIVADTAGNQVVTEAVLNSREAVRNGNMLSEPLSQSPVFPPMVTRMIAIGERSGALETLLEKIADFYDAQVKAQIKSLTSLIEPMLISFMGVIVGGVVLSVFLPILDIVGKLGG